MKTTYHVLFVDSIDFSSSRRVIECDLGWPNGLNTLSPELSAHLWLHNALIVHLLLIFAFSSNAILVVKVNFLNSWSFKSKRSCLEVLQVMMARMNLLINIGTINDIDFLVFSRHGKYALFLRLDCIKLFLSVVVLSFLVIFKLGSLICCPSRSKFVCID